MSMSGSEVDSPASPRLPGEICDLIIDSVDSFPDTDERLQSLAMCCRVCCTWKPRSRLHLWRIIVIRSHPGLYRVAEVLSKYRPRVQTLVVDAAGSRLSLITEVPLRLSNDLIGDAELMFRNINLAASHPCFYQLCSRYRGLCLKRLHLEQPRWSQFAQVLRLIAAIHCAEAYIAGGVESDFTASLKEQSAVLVCGAPLQTTHLTMVLPWPELGFPRAFTPLQVLAMRSTKGLRQLAVRFQLDPYTVPIDYGSLWVDQLKAFERIREAANVNNSQPRRETVGLEVTILGLSRAKIYGATLYEPLRDGPTVHSGSGIVIHLNSLHEGCMDILEHFLLALSSTALQLGQIGFGDPEEKTASFIIGNYFRARKDFIHWIKLDDAPSKIPDEFSALWKKVYTVLSRRRNHLAPSFRIHFMSLPTSPEQLPRGYKCEDELVRELLPKLASRLPLNHCNGACFYHVATNLKERALLNMARSSTV